MAAAAPLIANLCARPPQLAFAGYEPPCFDVAYRVVRQRAVRHALAVEESARRRRECEVEAVVSNPAALGGQVDDVGGVDAQEEPPARVVLPARLFEIGQRIASSSRYKSNSARTTGSPDEAMAW